MLLIGLAWSIGSVFIEAWILQSAVRAFWAIELDLTVCAWVAVMFYFLIRAELAVSKALK